MSLRIPQPSLRRLKLIRVSGELRLRRTKPCNASLQPDTRVKDGVRDAPTEIAHFTYGEDYLLDFLLLRRWKAEIGVGRRVTVGSVVLPDLPVVGPGLAAFGEGIEEAVRAWLLGGEAVEEDTVAVTVFGTVVPGVGNRLGVVRLSVDVADFLLAHGVWCGKSGDGGKNVVGQGRGVDFKDDLVGILDPIYAWVRWGSERRRGDVYQGSMERRRLLVDVRPWLDRIGLYP